ncbi:MAG: PQQ-dependent sugar dehydrogenase [Planctomycetota bacterium]|jgi:glucose/arabinose dehydrogenase
MQIIRGGLLSLAAIGCVCGTGLAQIPSGDVTIRLDLVVDGLVGPVGATHAGDGSGRLFIVDQAGQIRIVQDGALLATPFLDLTDKIVEVSAFFDERGVLGLAFHPDYENNGRFFVRYSAPREGDPDEPCNDPDGFIVGCHKEVLAEYAVSADPNVADPDSEVILFEVDEPQFNHDAGEVAFGPDGFLYFSLGDGGGAHDGLADVPPSHGPIGNGQNIETALGSMLRIDVDSPPDPGLPYAIPPDNPFVGVPGVDEIYAYGMRNPFKFSFDDGPGGDGRLFLGDVGQNLFEEIDIVELGGNYGWVIREGANCFDPFDPINPPDSCPSTGPLGEPLIDPIAEYDHPDGIAVIGGFVYRGSLFPELSGKYVFGDFSTAFFAPLGRLFWLDADGVLSDIFEFRLGEANDPLGLFVKGFGEDEAGELYLLASINLGPVGTTGKVFHIVSEVEAGLDVKPGSCPNSLSRRNQGVLPVALAGSASFDAAQVDISSVRLVRADGVGGEVSPIAGPPGSHPVLEDVATPFDGEGCDCHELEGDGLLDLSVKFRAQDVVGALELGTLPQGTQVEVVVNFDLVDGTSFTSAGDCIRVVGPVSATALAGPRSGGGVAFGGTDGLPAPDTVPADLNGDGAVNVLDLMQMLLAFGTADPAADITGDGLVNVLDLIELLTAFGT